MTKRLLSIGIYSFTTICVAGNVYILFCGVDTIFYLRVYHGIASFLMASAISAMIMFLWKASYCAKRHRRHQLHGQTLVALFVLTAVVAIGFLFFIIFTLAYQDCDKLLDIPQSAAAEMELDIAVYAVVSMFACIALVYVLQRCNHGRIDRHWESDYLIRRWINAVTVIMWAEVLVHKAYLGQKDLCILEEQHEHWCPIKPRKGYQCYPDLELDGMRRIWYYIYDGLLKSTVQQSAAEYFPVLLVAHWVACGGGHDELAHGDDSRLDRVDEKSNLSNSSAEGSSLESSKSAPVDSKMTLSASLTTVIMNVLSFVCAVTLTFRWFVHFYYTMRFNKLDRSWPLYDYSYVAQGIVQLIFYCSLYAWAMRLKMGDLDRRLSAHARGDIIILGGSVAFLAAEVLLLIAELQFQLSESLVTADECWQWTVARLASYFGHLLQFLALRRVVSLSDEALRDVRHFLPYVSIAAVIANWSFFSSSFFNMQLYKFQLSHPEVYKFADGALLCNIFIQILFSANFLYAFTAAGLWTHVFLRYWSLKYFQIGLPAGSTEATSASVQDVSKIIRL